MYAIMWCVVCLIVGYGAGVNYGLAPVCPPVPEPATAEDAPPAAPGITDPRRKRA